MKPSRELVAKLLGVPISVERMIRRTSAEYGHSGEIQQAGDPIEDVLLVLDGKIRAHYAITGEDPLIVDYEKGSIVGSIELLADMPAMADWRSMDASFVRVKPDGFHWLYANLKSAGGPPLRQLVDNLHQSPLMRPFYELLVKQRTGHSASVLKVTSHQADDAPFVGVRGLRPIVVGGELIVARRDRPRVEIARFFPHIRLGDDPFRIIGVGADDLVYTALTRTELAWIEDPPSGESAESVAASSLQRSGATSDFWDVDGLDPELFRDSRDATSDSSLPIGEIPRILSWLIE